MLSKPPPEKGEKEALEARELLIEADDILSDGGFEEKFTAIHEHLWRCIDEIDRLYPPPKD